MLLPYPHKLTTLVHIHYNPSYYTKWILLTMESNFGFGVSVSAEQNHASFAAHLGKGINLCIAEHIKLLEDRQSHLAKVRQTEGYKLLSMIDQFKSNKVELRGENESKARKVMSFYMNKKFLS